jgi:hypothetical protein
VLGWTNFWSMELISSFFIVLKLLSCDINFTLHAHFQNHWISNFSLIQFLVLFFERIPYCLNKMKNWRFLSIA